MHTPNTQFKVILKAIMITVCAASLVIFLNIK